MKSVTWAASLALTFSAIAPSYGFNDPIDTPASIGNRAINAMSLGVASNKEFSLTVGERGIVLRRSEEKVEPPHQWLQVGIPTSVNLTNVAITSARHVIAVGHDGVILRSQDSGISWERVFDGGKANIQIIELANAQLEKARAKPHKEPDLERAEFALEDAQAGARFGPSRPFLDVYFATPNVGWVVGSYGQIFESIDSGKSWQLIADRLNNPDLRHLNAISGDGDSIVMIAAEAGIIFKSKDAGHTWIRQETGYNGHLYGVSHFQEKGKLVSSYAYGFSGRIFKQPKGLDTWREIKSATREPIVDSVQINEHLIFVDQKGQLLRLDDSGDKLLSIENTGFELITGMSTTDYGLRFSTTKGPRDFKISFERNSK